MDTPGLYPLTNIHTALATKPHSTATRPSPPYLHNHISVNVCARHKLLITFKSQAEGGVSGTGRGERALRPLPAPRQGRIRHGTNEILMRVEVVWAAGRCSRAGWGVGGGVTCARGNNHPSTATITPLYLPT